MSKLFQRIVVFAAVWLICIRLGVLLTMLAVLGSDTTPPVGSGLTGAEAWFWAASESDAQADRTAIVSSRILNWECTGTAVATVFCLLQRWKNGLRVGMAHPRDSEVQARIEMHAHIVGPGKGLGGELLRSFFGPSVMAWARLRLREKARPARRLIPSPIESRV